MGNDRPAGSLDVEEVMGTKPICMKCHRFFKPHKTGFWFIEGMPKVNLAEPGLASPEKWVPYKIWHGDIWKCQGCDATIIVGTGYEPAAIHHQEERFAAFKKHCGKVPFQVNDC